MPQIERPGGARIYYEVRGSGFPLLVFAPGGVNSQVDFWEHSAFNPFDLADEFMVIGMNQRNADRSPAPLEPPTWDLTVADQLAVLDAISVDRTLLWGGCIGVAYVLRFIKQAPARVAGAVGQNPVGFVDGLNSRETFFAMMRPTIDAARTGGMQAVVDAAMQNPMFVRNNAAGPFAARIHDDEAFRKQVLQLDPAAYEQLIRQYDDNLWGAEVPYCSVDAAFVATITTPLLILPGDDPFHPTPIAERIGREASNARCLDRSAWEPANHAATMTIIRDFLRASAR